MEVTRLSSEEKVLYMYLSIFVFCCRQHVVRGRLLALGVSLMDPNSWHRGAWKRVKSLASTPRSVMVAIDLVGYIARQCSLSVRSAIPIQTSRRTMNQSRCCSGSQVRGSASDALFPRPALDHQRSLEQNGD